MNSEHILGTAASLILPTADKAEVYPHHWVCGGDGGISYCPECVDLAVAALLQDGGDPEEILVDGGYDWPEEESVRVCDGPPAMPSECGRLLQYTLIDRSSELEYFESLTDEEIRGLSPAQAHELLRVLEGSDPERKQSENERRTLEVSMRVIVLLGHGVVKEIKGVLGAKLAAGKGMG